MRHDHYRSVDPREEDSGADQAHEKRERFRELLEELRVVIPGTQVLFAFLLMSPFSARFNELHSDERSIFGVALLATAVATVFLVAPAVYHRIERRATREERLRTSVWMAMAGVFSLAVGVVAAIRVIVGFVWGDTAAGWASVLMAALILCLWYLLPLLRRA